MNAQQEAEVYLAVAATCPLQPLLNLVHDLSAVYPGTHIRFSRENMGGVVERLLDEQADIVIASLDGVPTDQVEALPFIGVNIIPVAHPDYEPAKTSAVKSNQEMQNYVQVVVADSSQHQIKQSRDVLAGALRWTVSDFSAKKEIILAKMGWGGVPEHLIDEELASGQLVKLNIAGFTTRHSQLYKIRRKHYVGGIVAQSLWDSLQPIDQGI